MGALADIMGREAREGCADFKADLGDDTIEGLMEMWALQNLTRCGRDAFVKARSGCLEGGGSSLDATREGILAAVLSEAAGTVLSQIVAKAGAGIPLTPT